MPPCVVMFFFLMIRRPPRSTRDRSSAASDVYKRQLNGGVVDAGHEQPQVVEVLARRIGARLADNAVGVEAAHEKAALLDDVEAVGPVSYTHLRAHETVLDLVCRLLLEKKKKNHKKKKTRYSRAQK